MNAKLLSLDISKEQVPTLTQRAEVELDDGAEEILGRFLNEVDEFARVTMERSGSEHQQFLTQWQDKLNEASLKKENSSQQFEIIEKRIFQLSQEKVAAENALVELEKSAARDIAYREEAIHDLNSRLNGYIKTVELQSGENQLLKQSLERVKSANADLESVNKILSAEIKIHQRELEFTEKKFLHELSELTEKINSLQEKSDSAISEAENLKRDKANAEIAHIQSQKALENAETLNRSLRIEIQSKEEEIRKREEKTHQTTASQMRKINELEGKLYQNGAQQSHKIQEFEHKINHLETELIRKKAEVEATIKAARAATDENQKLKKMVEKEQAINSNISHLNKTLSEQAKAEKKSLEEIKNRAHMETVALQKEIDELTSKLIDAQKQKELFIANKLNNTLQVKRDTYIDQSPGKVSKALLIIVPLMVISILGYIFHRYYSPMLQEDLERRVTALSRELENKSEYINSITKDRHQLTAKLDDLTRQLQLFQEKVGKNLVKLEENQVSIIENQEKKSDDKTVTFNQSQRQSEAYMQSDTNREGGTSILPLRYQIKESIYFDSGSSRLNQEGIVKIERLAEHYNESPDIFIRLEGHTDDKMFRLPMFQQYSNNVELSIARAAEVSRLLVQYGVDTRQISIVGLGDMEPLAPNDNSENRGKNRRVEIKVGNMSPQEND